MIKLYQRQLGSLPPCWDICQSLLSENDVVIQSWQTGKDADTNPFKSIIGLKTGPGTFTDADFTLAGSWPTMAAYKAWTHQMDEQRR